MWYPNEQQIGFAIKLCQDALRKLIERDSGIFNSDDQFEEYFSSTEDVHVLNRKLHEVTINHRLAVYLEELLKDSEYKNHSIDLEYNRFYNHPKEVETFEGVRAVRPDILVHTRTNKGGNPQHYMVIEAKKETISDADLNKIFGLLTDDRYNYLFGLTVSYCKDPNYILADLYFRDQNNIYQHNISVSK